MPTRDATTLLCVPIMADDPLVAKRDALLAAELGADLVEYRVDNLFHGEGDEEGQRAVLELVEDSPLPCIVTCRPTFEGGDYDGDDSARISLYEALGTSDHPPKYIDVELATYQRSANLRQKVRLAVDHDAQHRDVSTSLILSAHDFEKRPDGLLKILLDMREDGAHKVTKLAYRARSVRDILELFEILRERDRPTIALGMGEAGLASRVLAPKFGAFLTFASLRDESATAPGQPTIRDLLDLYRFRSINAETQVYGVVGHPVAHSKSPLIHNAGFGATGTNAVYLPLPVPPEWEHFKATVLALLHDEHLDLRGLSVTIPHKAHALKLAREQGWGIDPISARAGAANTITKHDDGTISVSNTDGAAALACLRDALTRDIAGAHVAILGAGGVARGIAAALLDTGARIHIYNRTKDNADALASDLRDHLTNGTNLDAAPLEALPDTAHDAYINATSIGMTGGPAPEDAPLQESHMQRLAEQTVIMDTVYTPIDTPFLRQARQNGLQTIDGERMFLRQAAAQFEQWTCQTAPIDAFKAAMRATAP
ncbi:EMB3004 [Symbiodinium necroappetens]|uniref:shikimate dehydrogenase (NADP(+)) n=1 Tax=Symbiodinium necroappetens TaxID=1628268 RepID=A0A812JU13_9DINO|nr:EMB3004 [Symbiodinium necroappetens]